MDSDQVPLNKINMNKALINVSGSCSEEGEESTRNQIAELDITNNILEDKKGVRDSNLSFSQDPKRKRKLLDMLLGCFRCNKKQL